MGTGRAADGVKEPATNRVDPAYDVERRHACTLADLVGTLGPGVLRVAVAPTLREPDGLAMSSRNKYLAGPLRAQATVLWRAIQRARAAARAAVRPLPAARLKNDLKNFID